MHLRIVAVLVLSPLSMAVGATGLSDCRVIKDDAARLACYDATFGPEATTTSRETATEAAKIHPEQNFGAEQLPQTTKGQEADSIQAHIQGNFEGWEPKTRFKLDNGQVWQVTDDHSVYYPPTQNPAVTIEKSVFGGYFLRIDGLNSRARIKRIQ